MLRRSVGLILLAGSLAGLGTGCKKKTDETPTPTANASKAAAAPQAPKQLPGENEVMAAIDKKDYDGAMAILLQVGQSVRTEDQKVQFMVLSQNAKMKMMDAAATDPKAAQAVKMIRAMTLGR